MDLACAKDGCHVPLCGARGRDHLLEVMRRRDAQLSRRSDWLGALVLLQVVILASLGACFASGILRISPDHKVANGKDQILSEKEVSSESSRAKEQLHTPSALLAVKLNCSTDDVLLEWQKTGDTTYMNGFTYNEGYLVVPRDGLYRVYLQVTYKYRELNFCHKAPALFLMLTVRNRQESYNEDRTILTSSDTVNCTFGAFTKSLYTAKDLQLHTNDSLSVLANNCSLISREESEVFFGACFQST